MVPAEILFWVAIGLIAYAYVGYPLVILALAAFHGRKVRTGDIEPMVTLLVTAYNEEKSIAAKLGNSLELDYPAEKLEIVVASDGSTDRTDEIVRGFEKNERGVRVALHRVEGRVGKTGTQNEAVKVCRGEIIVFSDAASLYDRRALRALVRNYADPEVGAVSGRYEYTNPTGAGAGRGTKAFWAIENFIKRRQSLLRTITGCCGCIYSLRKNLYVPLPHEIISDLVEPLTILDQGYRIVFEPEALALEETAGNAKQEFRMRVRVIVRGMNGMLFMRRLLNPLRYPFVALQLYSHKVLRWLVPLFALCALGANIVLAWDHAFYRWLLAAHAGFYACAAFGWVLDKRHVRTLLFSLPLYFCVVNLASLVSMCMVLRGRKIVTWQTQR